MNHCDSDKIMAHRSLSFNKEAGVYVTYASLFLPFAEAYCSEVLQCHGAAEEALAAAAATIKGLLALPAQAAQVRPSNDNMRELPSMCITVTVSSWQLQDIVVVHRMHCIVCNICCCCR